MKLAQPDSEYRILIIKFSALGDVIRTSHILPGLYEKYCSPSVYWLTSAVSLEVLRFNPYITHLTTPEIDCDQLQRIPFDLIISLDDEADILKIIDGLTYKKITGAFMEEGRSVYTQDSSEWFDMGLISRFDKTKADLLKKRNSREHNQILSDMLGIRIEKAEFFNSSVVEARKAKDFDQKFFNIGLNSGAGGRWASKQLPMDHTVALVEGLLDMRIGGGGKVCIYLLGGKEENSRHQAITDRISSARLRDTGNDNTLLEFAAIIKQCDYVITSDSLALHLAISQGCKNLSFYAPTSAAEIGTFGTGTKVVSLADDYCSYRPDVDNSSITAGRILEAMHEHLRMLRMIQ